MASKTPPVPPQVTQPKTVTVVSVSSPPPIFPAASDEYTIRTLQPDLVAAATAVQNDWTMLPPVAVSMESVWEDWYTLQRSFPGTAGTSTLSERVRKSESAQRLAGFTKSFFSKEGEKEIAAAIPIYQNGRGMTLEDAYDQGLIFLNPTMETLSTMKWSCQLGLSNQIHYHNLYRVLKYIGSGSYGQVFANGMRTPSMDKGILAILSQAGVAFTKEWRDMLVDYLGSRFKLIAMKESLVEASDLPREYAITQEVASILYPLGIKAIAAPYALKNWRDSNEYPVGMPNYSAFANPRSPSQQESIAIVRNATVLSGDVATGHYKYQMHSQYIRGARIDETSITLEQLNGTYAYLHSVMAILWNRGTIIHNDIHGGNVYLEGWGMGNTYILPICDVYGNHLFNIELPFRPILLDWGMACSATNNTYGVESSPRRSQLNDILGLYTGLHLRGLELGSVGFDFCTQHLAPYITEFAAMSTTSSIPHLHSPPYGLVVPHVDHSSLLQAYFDSGLLVPLMTDKVEQLSPTVHFSPSDPVAYAEIREEAERIRKAYYDDTFINSAPLTDPRRYIRAYLKETIAFYS